jgi:phage terminase large subunit-like protein
MRKKPDTVARMTPEQASLLRKLAFDAYEPEAFSTGLTRTEAEQRICVLKAKLKLISEPPHTQ